MDEQTLKLLIQHNSFPLVPTLWEREVVSAGSFHRMPGGGLAMFTRESDLESLLKSDESRE